MLLTVLKINKKLYLSRFKNLILSEIKKSNVRYECVSLNIGDYTWIARSKEKNKDDIILNILIQRKGMDELNNSLKEGSFGEEKVSFIQVIQ